ncbi:hypothetical protein IV454_28630 [Massilia antarctica]|uniref:Uncharacterized protein n=1 Tax=Massilia antarctica TaxID=2765360 RepID=A0AA49A7R2_9BURK|nr:hypothetical protein [Massilia antarctica]QPI49366.1 hypothetical protein IV454_28630 [Massilia antarctica]
MRALEHTEWTDARKFRIDASRSLPFVVPSETDLKKFISARGAVRSLPPELLANPNAQLSEERMKLRVRL